MSLHLSTADTGAQPTQQRVRGLSNSARRPNQPQPGLGSGSSPPAQKKQHASSPQDSIKFGSTATKLAGSVSWKNLFGPTAMAQLGADMLGVWFPKVLSILVAGRGLTFLIEETELEVLEDLFGFYFPVTGFGMLFAPLAKKLAKLEEPIAAIGKSLVGETGQKTLSKSLVAAKSATLLGALAVASGFEFLIQHAKNMTTAHFLNVKNFNAVTGLVENDTQVKEGEEDPVHKAKRRIKQVAAATTAGLATAAALPFLIRKSSILENGARNVLQFLDFGTGKPFDLSKPILAILALLGAVSYIDAARDSNERKETGERLCVVIPFMLGGKELVGWAIAKLHERFASVKDELGKKINLQSLKGFSFTNGNNPFKQAMQKATFLDTGVLQSELSTTYTKLAKTDPRFLSETIKDSLSAMRGRINILSWIVSASICGIGINVLTYNRTKKRVHAEKAQAALQQQALKQQALALQSASHNAQLQNSIASQNTFWGQSQAGFPRPAAFPAMAGPMQTFQSLAQQSQQRGRAKAQ